MLYLAYNVRYSVVPVNSSLLTVTLCSSVVTTPVYNHTNYPGPFCDVKTEFDCTCIIITKQGSKYQAEMMHLFHRWYSTLQAVLPQRQHTRRHHVGVPRPDGVGAICDSTMHHLLCLRQDVAAAVGI